jgi:hypothetical protein
MESGSVLYKRMMRLAETIIETEDEQTSDALELADTVSALNKRLMSQPDFPREWISI